MPKLSRRSIMILFYIMAKFQFSRCHYLIFFNFRIDFFDIHESSILKLDVILLVLVE